ncbi:MAG: chemotaxis protein CheB [Methylococcaceae bacterium]|nr:chemotaxis protein CheB [Methylococcaceae bacterium]
MTPHLVVIGASLGGLEALRVLFRELPSDFPAAIVIVQHRAMEESGELAMLLGEAGSLSVGFPLDKERILAGHVYIAPPNYHLLVEEDHFAFSLDAQENHARPSIDVLFESVADACGPSVTGIVLTGTGQDGARGLATIHRRGGLALVQSPREARAPQMPLAALEAVPDARQLTLEEIGQWLFQLRIAESFECGLRNADCGSF